jgi:nitrate reductase gamma subunit
MYSFVAVLGLLVLAYVGVEVLGLHQVFGAIIPLVALLLFLVGFVWRVLVWAKRPVPFRIPTSCGQQKSLDWIKSSPLDNPHTKMGVVGRMILEVLLFRSLFRNTKTEVRRDGQVVHGSDILLWLVALAFHWCFLIVVLRHLRFFFEPVPLWLVWLVDLDGFLETAMPTVLVTGVVLLVAATYLFLRRVFSPQLRYISLPADYFPLLLIIGITITGLLLRHVVRTDIVGVKEVAMGMVSLQPTAGDGIHWLFFVHIFFVSALLIYFPFSKLMHMGGVLLSPTRNMANNNRRIRHVNPWDYPVPVHSYEEYEDHFRDKMKAAGIPLDREETPEVASEATPKVTSTETE